MIEAPVLSVEGLSVKFRTRAGIVHAVDNVSFVAAKGETVALVGELGSGKSVTAYALMGLLDPAGRVTGGRAVLNGLNLLSAKPSELAAVRGCEIAMIFQSPRTALNPIRPVGHRSPTFLRATATWGAWKHWRSQSHCCAPSAFLILCGAPARIRSKCPAECVSGS